RVAGREALRDLELSVVCYERRPRVLARLEAIAEVWGDREIVVARELTKQFEEIVRGPAAVLRERFGAGPVRGEFTLILPSPRFDSRRDGSAVEGARCPGAPRSRSRAWPSSP